MTYLPSDPMATGGIKGFAALLRAKRITIESAIEKYLHRIAALDPKLGAFEYVDPNAALAAARALDRLLAAGSDLGPLMGVPIAVKDLFYVKGMPTTAGSKLEVNRFVFREGQFIQMLRRLGRDSPYGNLPAR